VQYPFREDLDTNTNNLIQLNSRNEEKWNLIDYQFKIIEDRIST
jgi:hypothetical protein